MHNLHFRAKEEREKKEKQTLEEQTNVNTYYYSKTKHDYAIKTPGNLVWCRVIAIYNQLYQGRITNQRIVDNTKFCLPTTSFKHQQILPTSSCVCHRNHPNNGRKQSSPQQLLTSSKLNTLFIFISRLESPCCSAVSESLATDYNQFRIWLLLSIWKWTWNNRKPYLRKLTQVTLLDTWILTLYGQKNSLTKATN